MGKEDTVDKITALIAFLEPMFLVCYIGVIALLLIAALIATRTGRVAA